MEIMTPSLEMLFEQLGLESDQASIDAFVAAHQLPEGEKVSEADFWTENQAGLLKEKIQLDDDWAPIVDELNVLLHTPT
ncbi:DUF2789 family protein [Pseudomonas graminis]|uniref:DUF2789 domain-containing protein n=1 Tax=Pseudomonas graminis TaxID=158627 RepID=A0A1C2EFG0_9PSED|nr:DUF2789 family protein [Pseudomonas graminis]OCX25677.1 hypothetical protein BBI10_01330 [Pseudomonas graminis]